MKFRGIFYLYLSSNDAKRVSSPFFWEGLYLTHFRQWVRTERTYLKASLHSCCATLVEVITTMDDKVKACYASLRIWCSVLPQ